MTAGTAPTTAVMARSWEATPRPEQVPPASAPLDQVVKFQAPEVVFGHNSLEEAGYSAARLGARRPFVVTDPGIVEAGWVDALLRLLRAEGLAPVLWTDVTPNPKDHEVRRAYERYVEVEADVIVAIGGGSCMDAAKGVAVLSGNGGDILDYAGIDQIARPSSSPTRSTRVSGGSDFVPLTDQ